MLGGKFGKVFQTKFLLKLNYDFKEKFRDGFGEFIESESVTVGMMKAKVHKHVSHR